MSSADSYTKGLEYIEQFQIPRPQWLEDIKELGIAYKVPIIDDDMGVFLKLVCSIKKPRTILEIGCGISYATHWMLSGYPEAQIIGLDYNQQRLDFCGQFLEQSGFSDNVTLKRTWAHDFFAENHDRFDLIFQDATKKEYGSMIDPCFHRLNSEGLLIVDNIFYNGKAFGLEPDQIKKYGEAVKMLEQFNRTISAHPGFDCHYLAISDGVLVAQRKS